jgi:magnesium chelatase family protein
MGKTMLAERLSTVLPRLEPDAALEVTSIHSLAGILRPASPLVTEPPFCAPHRTSTRAAIVGGSGRPAPGSAGRADFSLLNRLAGAGMSTPPAERVCRREES